MAENQQSVEPSTTTTTATAPAVANPKLRTGSRQGRKGAPAATPIPTLRQIRKDCLFNINYHAARESFLAASHRWIMFAVIVLGASAVLDLFPNQGWLRGAAAAMVTILGTIDLALELGNRARTHALMRKSYSDIMVNCLKNPDELANANAALMALAGQEEPGYHALLTLCHNVAETQVYDNDDHHLVVPRWHRVFRHFFQFEGHQYANKH